METESEEDKMAEVYNAITGDFLTENVERAFNNDKGPRIFFPSLYKGLTPAMQQAVYDHQAKQRDELKMKREAFEKQEKDWAELLNMQIRCSKLSDQEIQRKKRNIEYELKDFNLTLANEQKHEQDVLNNELYKSKASDEFYDQFNRTTR